MNRDELRQNVDTIIVVMMENRSFDHVLGHLSLSEGGNREDLDGIVQLDNPAYMNPADDGTLEPLFTADDRAFASDMPHDKDSVNTQLAFAQVLGGFAMNGFVKAYEHAEQSSRSQPPVMGILKADAVPVTGFLANQYLVCDRWFASLPTSTQPNRLMAMSGFSRLDDTYAGLLPDQHTVLDWLSDRGVRWRVYSAGLSFFALMPRLAPLLLTSHFRDLDDFTRDIAHEGDSQWPEVIFIEPDYNDSPVHSRHACDNHPPLPMAFGEAFLADVMQALAANPHRGNKTVMILNYDEHGGFFDHVPPLDISYTVAGSGHTFNSTGVRVPAIVVSPYVQAGAVSHINLDHTSVLQLIAERFNNNGEPYSAEVESRRLAGIGSISQLLDATAGNGIVAPPVSANNLSATATLIQARSQLSNNQRAFIAAARMLLSRHGPEALAKYPMFARLK